MSLGSLTSSSSLLSSAEVLQPLGIIAGAGGMPLALAQAVAAQGRAVFIVALQGMADPWVMDYPHAWVKPFQVGRILSCLHQAGAIELVMAGSVARPRLSEVSLDWTTLKYLSVLLFSRRSGDDRVLRRVTLLLEKVGFHVRSIADVAPSLVAQNGLLAGRAPTPDQMSDIVLGLKAARLLGQLDAGQACVVHRGRILALEAAEGTDQMLHRVAQLRLNGRFKDGLPSGILIKAPKPQQELRNDMPVVGLDTVRLAIEAGLSGIAVLAGGVVLVDGEAAVAAAAKAGLFIYGFNNEQD